MGMLIYVVGASGSGKDTIMQNLRKEMGYNTKFIFAHRYITRPAELGGENYISLTEEEFQARIERGLFAMQWSSHGYRYGIGIEIKNWMEKGFNVLVNGSREYLPDAANVFPDLMVVVIEVSAEKLKERLIKRARENLDEIEKRLEQSQAFHVDHPNKLVINNDGEVEQTTKQLLEKLHQRCNI